MKKPGWIKICGVTTADDATTAAALGADMIGVNFFPGSPRFAAADKAAAILDAIAGSVEAAAVLVKLEREQYLADEKLFARFGAVQCHDNRHEPRPWLSRPLVAAFAVREKSDLATVSSYVEACKEQNCLPRAVLIDAFAPGLYGGSGKTAPWELLAGFDPSLPLILAGGLTPDNVSKAIRLVRPFGVDVASGVESAPGRKDHEKMRRFIEEARAAFS
jgi:phosphoribosylanthranilate isomerase